MEFLQTLFVSVLVDAATALLFLTPLLGLLLWLNRDRKTRRLQLQEPFTDLPLRPAGESLRIKIDELSAKVDEYVTVLALVGAVSTGLVLGAPSRTTPTIIGVSIAANLVTFLYAGPRLRTLARQLHEHRLGFKGERVIAEILNRLQADGFRVYHDLPFDRYNIDHVIVGACGVFVVETKTRSKRTDTSWEKKAVATFDGQRITFGKHVETAAVKQASINAKDLTTWLSSATGEHVAVDPIITSPGWFVADALPINGIAMWNPSRIRAFLLAKPQNVLGPEQRKRICHQLDQRCAWTEVKS